MKSPWDRSLVEQLITLYQQHENLYNINNIKYKLKEEREKSFEAICKCLQEVNAEITVKGVRRKLCTMRNRYIVEDKKIKAGIKSVPTLWFYHLMEFLQPHITKGSSDKPAANSQPDENINTIFEQDIISSEDSVSVNSEHSATEGISAIKLEVTPSITEGTDGLSQSTFDSCHDYDWLGQQVMFELTNINDIGVRRETAWKIQNILREGAMADLALQGK